MLGTAMVGFLLAPGCKDAGGDSGNTDGAVTSGWARIQLVDSTLDGTGGCAQRADGSGTCFGLNQGLIEAGPAHQLVMTVENGPLAAGLDGSVVSLTTGEDIRALRQYSYDDVLVGQGLQCGLQSGGHAECATHDGEHHKEWADVTTLAMIGTEVCVLKSSGEVSCGKVYSDNTQQKVGEYQDLAQGHGDFCAQAQDGVWACGRELDGGEWDPSPGAAEHATAVVSGACVWDQGGSASCWRTGSSWVTDEVLSPPDGGWLDLSLGLETGCGVDTAGEIECWGEPLEVPQN